MIVTTVFYSLPTCTNKPNALKLLILLLLSTVYNIAAIIDITEAFAKLFPSFQIFNNFPTACQKKVTIHVA